MKVPICSSLFRVNFYFVQFLTIVNFNCIRTINLIITDLVMTLINLYAQAVKTFSPFIMHIINLFSMIQKYVKRSFSEYHNLRIL